MVGRIVFVEGAGNEADQRADCRRTFQSLMRKLNDKVRVRVMPCGSRGDAYRKFKRELDKPNATAYLLVDSEGVVEGKFAGKPWAFLKAHDKWTKPKGATDEQAHLMAVMSETWIVADAEALEGYYGKGFTAKSLPKRDDLEQAPKAEIEKGLKEATRKSAKGAYHKTGHAFDLIASLDPGVVRERCPGWAARFFRVVETWT
jgi:hypothetical protein